MKITKFAQSCVLVETKGKRLLIDPGRIMYDEKLLTVHWTNIDVILVTHRHGDHIFPDAIKELVKSGAKFFTTQEVADTYPELSPEIRKEGDVLEFDEIKIELVHAVHGYLPRLTHNNAEINENVGYIVDDGEKRVYHTSDTVCFKNNYKCDVLVLACNNHGVAMGPYAAGQFAKEIQPKVTIPVHCDNPELPGDLESVAEEFKKLDLSLKVLDLYESIEI
jgi:L-ascorbate metabolism protein UlaG (beta-lactamase superfamily)